MSVSIELQGKEEDNDVEVWKSGLEKGVNTIKIVGKCE